MNRGAEERIALLGPGQFSGESTMLAGRRMLVNVRARDAGEVVEVKRDAMLALSSDR